MSSTPIRFETPDAARLDELFRRAPEIVREEMRRFLTICGIHLEAEVKDRTPTGAHQLLRQSIAHSTQESGDQMLGVVGSPLSYAPAVELGTKPHWAPIQPLGEWVRLKLGITGWRAEAAAQRIQYAIAHRGTLGVGMFHRAFAANRKVLAQQYQAAVQRIIDRIGS